MLSEKVWCVIQQKFMKGVIEIAIHDEIEWPANTEYPCGKGAEKTLCEWQDQILLKFIRTHYASSAVCFS